MIWWTRVHAIGRLVGVTVVLTIGAVALGPVALLFPSFGGSSPVGAVPVAAVAPLVITIAAGAAISRGHRAGSVRRTDMLELGTVALTATCVAAVCAIAVLVRADPALGAATVRNTIAFSALMVITRAWGGERFRSLPGVFYLLIAALFGRGADGRSAAWAGVITTDADVAHSAFVVPIVAVVLVIVVRTAVRGGSH